MDSGWEKGAEAPVAGCYHPPGPITAALTLALFMMMTPACAPRDDAPAGGEWRGTIEDDGSVATVFNSSGSVWGGPAHLAEELSIGVAEGEEPYMFGHVSGVWATEDRVYVVDGQVPAVRVYDREGGHLFDVGRAGEGPGEYTEPTAVATTPTGDIVVSESGAKLHFYGPDGSVIQTHSLGTNWNLYAPNTFVMSHSGTAFKTVIDGPAGRPGSLRMGRQGFAADGAIASPTFPPETGFEPWCLEYEQAGSGDTQQSCNVRFAPYEVGVFTPDQAWVVGTTDRYQFEIHGSDGSLTRVERAVDPVAISEPEIDHYRRWTQAYIRQWDPGWTWRGPQIPDHKPAYSHILPDRSARLWVAREGPSRRVEGPCTDEFLDTTSIYDATPCWIADTYFDAFAPDGRYLGELQVPKIAVFSLEAFIRDDVFIAPVEDEAGTITVKRYRIVIPGA